MMQELGKFNLEINVIPNGWENYLNISIDNKFIRSSPALSWNVILNMRKVELRS